TVQKSITCFISGTTYNPYQDRCEAYTANACDSLIFRTATGYCDLGDNSGCTYNGGTWDTDKKLCKKGSTYTAIKSDYYAMLLLQFKKYAVCADIYDYVNNKGQARKVYAQLDTKFFSTEGCRLKNISTNNIYFFSNCTNGQGTKEETIIYPGSEYIVDGNFLNPSGVFGCSSAGSSSAEAYLYEYTCPYGGTLAETEKTCSTVEYFAPDCSIYGTGYAHDGFGRCAKAPTCTAKTMPVSPYYATPYYGNNGVCYSDVGLYCKTYGVSFDGLYTCFNYQFGCDDSSYNLRTDTDVCEKFTLTCSTAKGKRYGLAESPTNNNVTDLYDRIIDKDTKANTYVSTIVNNDVTINDNAGAMCTALEYSTFTQGIFANDYTIGGEVKSGF
uniref:hypothetical protein n=1 Tax=Sulfurospirillum cavolei TaxID=366522 RepID=UPI003FA27B45